MWQSLIEFLSFKSSNILYVTLGSMILSAGASVVGAFTFFRKKALIGDAIAHSILPGVCLAFLFSGTKNYFLLITGAFISGWISILVVDYITNKSKIKEDTAIGLVLSVFFGIGVVLLTYIQQSGNAAQSGLDAFLFGKAASMIKEDVIVFSIISVILVITVLIFYKELKLISFDKTFAKSIGIQVRFIEFLLSSLTVLAIVSGIQSVGVVLMAALLITPTAAATYWSGRLAIILILGAIFGAFSGFTGAFTSYVAPNMPTGPWIVMMLSLIAFLSILFAPNKGYLSRFLKQQRNRRMIQDENILKAFYQISETDKSFTIAKSIKQIQARRYYSDKLINRIISRLKRQGYVQKQGKGFSLSAFGIQKAARLVKLHRLWELYLTQYLKIAPDHVHEDADTIEHLITPELEKQLEEKLKFPAVDPHNREIPYSI